MASSSDVQPFPRIRSEAAKVFQSADSASASDRWYVVHTRPHSEGKAVTHLQRQGYHVFLPRIRRKIRHARRTQILLAPLFPSYLFVGLNVEREPWRCINSTCGVARLLTQGEIPQPVPHGVVRSLQESMAEDGAINWAPALNVGQDVRVTDGPFVGLLGKLERMDSPGRVRVLLDLLGRSVSVALCREALSPAA